MALASLAVLPTPDSILQIAEITRPLSPTPSITESQDLQDTINTPTRTERLGRHMLNIGIDVSFLSDSEPTQLNLGRASYLLTIFRLGEMLEISNQQQAEIRALYDRHMPRRRWNIIGRITRRLMTLESDLWALDAQLISEDALASAL